MAASNTRECFSECVGRKIIGVLFDAFPLQRSDLSRGTKTFVFDDGSGLTLSSNGSFWQESASEIKRATHAKLRDLNATKAEIAQVLELAGSISDDA